MEEFEFPQLNNLVEWFINKNLRENDGSWCVDEEIYDELRRFIQDIVQDTVRITKK